VTGAAADRERLGRWLVPLQQDALAALSPDKAAWLRLIEGRGNEDWGEAVQRALRLDAAACEAGFAAHHAWRPGAMAPAQGAWPALAL
jgi:hypothetical protein